LQQTKMEKKKYHSFEEFFKSVKVEELIANQKVVTISSKETLEEGFTKLATHNILSAPVYDEEQKKYTGFLDMRDLVSSVVFIAEQNVEFKSTKTLKDLLVNAKWVGGSYTVTYLSRRNKYSPIHKGATLIDAVKLMGQKGNKLKRLPLVDEQGNPLAIISQSTIIQYVHKHIKEISDPKFHETIAKLNFGTSPCASVHQNVTAIDVFKIMDSKGFSGIALTDQSGKLTGNISSRDLKAFIKYIDFNLLITPVGEFVKHLRQTAQINISTPTITCFDYHTFEYVVEKLAATKVHRIYVVDNEEHFAPTRVISLLDTLEKLCP